MRALVMSGGGSRGSWEAGALKYMGEQPEFARGFDFISGTSVGSINAVGLAMFPPEHFEDGVNYVHKLWTDKVTKTSDIWQIRKPLGIPALWNPSIGTNAALFKLLEGVVDIDAIVASGIVLRLPAVDLETGEIHEFDTNDLVRYGILPPAASASFPVAFPPVEIADWWLTDGGVVDMAPLGSAIDAGADEIVVLLTRDANGVAYKSRKHMKNAIDVAMRVIDIMTQTVLMGDLAVAEMTNALVEGAPGHPKAVGKRKVKITILAPSKPLGESLDFSGDLMQAQMAQGYEDAKTQLGG